MPDPVEISPISGAEIDAAAGVLADAFRDNPLNVGVIDTRDGARRRRANWHGMRALLPVACRHGVTLAARTRAGVAGALIATLPHAYPLPPPSLWLRVRCAIGQGARVARRWREVFEALDALHPCEPHAYLGTLGVDPGLQGRGLGWALLECWLGEVDRDPVPAYLETDRPENVAFYARAGFEVEGETEIFGARIWLMRRPARRGSSD